MLSLMIYALVGGGLGAALGYLGKCASGTCPLTSSWWRGGIYGVVLGSLLYFMSGTRGSASLNESTSNVKLIRENEFDAEVMRATSPVVVDFYASWCGPCKRLSPLLDEIAGPLTNRVKFVKVNVDDSPALSRRFEVEAIPTVVFFRAGKVVDRFVGLIPESDLKARIDALVKTNEAAGTAR